MPTPYRGYSELPGAVTPDVPYRVNLMAREIDLDIHDLDRLTAARLGVLEHSAGLGDKPLVVQDKATEALLRDPESLSSTAVLEAVRTHAPAAAGIAALTGNQRWRGPLARFGAAVSAPEKAPCVVVSLGSSTAAGVGASAPALSWVHRLAGRLTSNPVTALDPAGTRPAKGVWFYNGAVSGAFSDGYLTDARVARIKTLRPALITHMVGSNDWGDGRTAAAYMTNMRSALTRLIAAAPEAVHLLIHQQTRRDHNPALPWSAFADALEQLAGEFPNNAVFFNAGEFFANYGLTLEADRAGLLAEPVHMNDSGHRIMADQIAACLGVPMHYADEEFASGPISGGEKTAVGTFATVTVPARPYPRRVTLHAQIFCGSSSGDADVQLRNGTDIGAALRMAAAAGRATRSGSANWVVPANTGASLNVYHSMGMYLTSSDIYARVYATAKPI